jgi:hypothetical protein
MQQIAIQFKLGRKKDKSGKNQNPIGGEFENVSL